jgi:hypothetical protein
VNFAPALERWEKEHSSPAGTCSGSKGSKVHKTKTPLKNERKR